MVVHFMKSVSAIFHPLLMATYTCLLFYWVIPEIYSPIPPQAIPYFILSVFVLTFLIPVISILFLRFTQRLSSLEMTRREERTLPFFFITAFYIITTYLFYSRMTLPRSLLVMMITVSALVSVIFLISLKFKISVHSAGIWGTAGIFSALSLKYLDTSSVLPLIIIFTLAGITTSSRLYLNRHTPVESWSGVGLGFISCFTGFLLFG